MKKTYPYIVGISGGSASGKTSFIKAIGRVFSPAEVCILSQDNYYKPVASQPLDENGQVNFDLPECLELDAFYEDIQQLKQGKGVKRREYRFQHEEQMGEWIYFEPAPIIIVEGLFVFCREDIAGQLNLKVFVEADERLQLERRLKRDTLERNIPADYVRYQWVHHVMPAYRAFLEPYKTGADIIVDNNEQFDESLKIIADHFRAQLGH